MCTPSTVLNPRLVVSSRRNDILSSRKWHESHAPVAVDTPAPADVMQVPLSGLPSPPTAVSGMKPFGCCRLRLADDRLERDLRELVGELLLAQEVEQRRIAVDRRFVEVAADRDPAPIGDLADVVEDLVERALAAAQRAHAVVRVAVAVERDLDADQAVGRQAIDDLRREQQAVGDDVDHHADAARCAASSTAARPGSRQPAGSGAARRRRTSARSSSGAMASHPRLRSTRRPAPRSPSTSWPRSCCIRRGRPGCSSRTRNCTAASSAP